MTNAAHSISACSGTNNIAHMIRFSRPDTIVLSSPDKHDMLPTVVAFQLEVGSIGRAVLGGETFRPQYAALPQWQRKGGSVDFLAKAQFVRVSPGRLL